jgi:hypothetical protein
MERISIRDEVEEVQVTIHEDLVRLAWVEAEADRPHEELVVKLRSKLDLRLDHKLWHTG